MAWASRGGYPGVTSTGYSALALDSLEVRNVIQLDPSSTLVVLGQMSDNLLVLHQGIMNDGLALEFGVGLFNHAPPGAATTGGAHTAGGTYTSTEQAMLEAVYTALQSIGLVT